MKEAAETYRDTLREDDVPDDAPLPEPWQRLESNSRPGKFYYRNPVTKESSWEFPVKSSSSRKRPAETQSPELKTCLMRDSLGPPLGITWSNVTEQKVYLDPASFYYPGPLPRFPLRARRHQLPRKPIIDGAEGNAKRIFFRSRDGARTFTQEEIQEFVESGVCEEGTRHDIRKAIKQAAEDARKFLRGALGKIHPQDLRRMWDSGASQGMTDRSKVSSDASIAGKRNEIMTSNGPVSSPLYEMAVIAPGLTQKHVALPTTANTVSISSLSVECQVGFQWLQPLSRETGCSLGFQALSPANLDVSTLDLLSSSSSSSSKTSSSSS